MPHCACLQLRTQGSKRWGWHGPGATHAAALTLWLYLTAPMLQIARCRSMQVDASRTLQASRSIITNSTCRSFGRLDTNASPGCAVAQYPGTPLAARHAKTDLKHLLQELLPKAPCATGTAAAGYLVPAELLMTAPLPLRQRSLPPGPPARS